MKNISFILLGIFLVAASCKKDTPKVSKKFTVTIQNVFQPKDYLNSGTTGLLKPGESAKIAFDAGIGQYLQLGTMFVQSNDLFVAPDDAGIALYDGRVPLTGDITGLFKLWDAGTEVNEMPGQGPNQPIRQSGPNTGKEENGTVGLVNDGFSYPGVSEVLKVTLEHDGGTGFVLTLENISANSSIPTPFAPGTWVIHSKGQYPMFKEGDKASPGLEALAEDGNIAKMKDNLSAKSGFFSPFAPGAYSVGSTNEVFMSGQPASAALEALAEDGDPSGFAHVFNTPEGATKPGPLLPGGSYSLSFDAEEGDQLSLALMLVQSNDWFVGVDKIDLFSNGAALDGDVTDRFSLYDAGTEVDEYAGAGNYQPLRQPGPNSGPAENGKVVKEAAAGAHVPVKVSDYLKVTIKSN